MRPATLLLVAAGALALAAPLRAQQPEACRAVLTAHNLPAARQGNNPCQTLAVMVASTAPSVTAAADSILRADAAPVAAVFTPRDLQAHNPQMASLAGTPGQGQAVPSIQPAGVAAGSIAAVGTDAGQDALAALDINPAILFLGDAVSRQLAQYSRFADLTVLLPVSSVGRDSTSTDSARLRYYGARLRLNVGGLSAGSAVWNRARALVQAWISRGGRNAQKVQQALAQAPDLAGCANALMNGAEMGAITAACGAPVSLEVDLAEAAQLRRELAAVRRTADARYFGADVRYDHGDPTFGAVQGASGESLYAGLAFGRSLDALGGTGGSVGVRSRLGVRQSRLDASDTTEFAVEGGLAFALARSIEAQQIDASAGIEFRHGNAPATLDQRLQTNYVVVRGSLLLPITLGNSLSLNFSTPLSGEVTPSLSVNFNWGLLLPNTLQR